MIVVTQDSRSIFSQELENCLNQNISWRCIIFDFWEKPPLLEGWFNHTLDSVSLCLGDEGARAFLFEEKNIVFLVKFATQKAFSKLIEQLSQKFNFDVAPYGQLYEVHIDKDIIKDKLSFNKKDHKIPPNSGEIIKKVFPGDNFYQELCQSLPARRNAREKPVILLIEDDPFSRRLIYKTLNLQYSVYEAEDGESGLESYIIHAPDVLFLDIGLPDANGLELMDKILKADPAAFIIILSGNGSKDNVLHAIQKGAQGFVAKPFNKERIFYYIDKSPQIQKKKIRV